MTKLRTYRRVLTTACSISLPVPVLQIFSPQNWYVFLSSSGKCGDRKNFLKERKIRAQAKSTSAECRSLSNLCGKATASAVNQFSFLTHWNKYLALCKIVFPVIFLVRFPSFKFHSFIVLIYWLLYTAQLAILGNSLQSKILTPNLISFKSHLLCHPVFSV